MGGGHLGVVGDLLGDFDGAVGASPID